VAVGVAVAVGVRVTVAVAVAVDVRVGVGVRVGVRVTVGVGVSVKNPSKAPTSHRPPGGWGRVTPRWSVVIGVGVPGPGGGLPGGHSVSLLWLIPSIAGLSCGASGLSKGMVCVGPP